MLQAAHSNRIVQTDLILYGIPLAAGGGCCSSFFIFILHFFPLLLLLSSVLGAGFVSSCGTVRTTDVPFTYCLRERVNPRGSLPGNRGFGPLRCPAMETNGGRRLPKQCLSSHGESANRNWCCGRLYLENVRSVDSLERKKKRERHLFHLLEHSQKVEPGELFEILVAPRRVLHEFGEQVRVLWHVLKPLRRPENAVEKNNSNEITAGSSMGNQRLEWRTCWSRRSRLRCRRDPLPPLGGCDWCALRSGQREKENHSTTTKKRIGSTRTHPPRPKWRLSCCSWQTAGRSSPWRSRRCSPGHQSDAVNRLLNERRWINSWARKKKLAAGPAARNAIPPTPLSCCHGNGQERRHR